MPDANSFRDLVSGARRGPVAAALRAGLSLAAYPYGVGVRWRNRGYDRGKGVVRVPAKVVSVGNLTLGGTGKTPLVEWIARWYLEQNLPVAIVSRGYKAQGNAPNDEARELAQRLPGVPHVQNPDRVAAAQQAIEQHGAKVIVLDDGFQHRRLGRDLDIVLLDATEPFGHGRLFPRGTLREPLASLARADVVALSRADMIGEGERISICNELAPHLAKAGWVEMAHAPRCLLRAGQGGEQGADEGEIVEAPLARLAGKRVAAFCGLGNPAGFRHTLTECGYEVAAFKTYPDHHHYTARDLETLTVWARGVTPQVDAIVCTHKDLVKINRRRLGEMPLWALTIGVKFLAGEGVLAAKLEQVF